jgi:ATP-independent RNA helicase DbpA
LDLYEALTGMPIERDGRPLDANPTPTPRMATLHIGAGRGQKMRPGDIVGALTGEIGLDRSDVGKIEIFDRCSYVALSAPLARAVAERLRAGSIKGRKFRVDVVTAD